MCSCSQWQKLLPTLISTSKISSSSPYWEDFEKTQSHHKKSCYQIGLLGQFLSWILLSIATPSFTTTTSTTWSIAVVACGPTLSSRACVSSSKGHHIRGKLDHMGRLDGLDELHNLVGMILAHSQMRQCQNLAGRFCLEREFEHRSPRYTNNNIISFIYVNAKHNVDQRSREIVRCIAKLN